MKDADGFLVFAPIKEEFGRFLKAEEDKSEEEHDESDTSKGEEEVSPSHVIGFGTARGSGLNVTTCLEWLVIGTIAT